MNYLGSLLKFVGCLCIGRSKSKMQRRSISTFLQYHPRDKPLPPVSRTVSRRPGHPTFEDPRFRYVSIITALNAQKDKINELGCKKFAEETNQTLTHFYSDDTLAANAASEGRKPKKAPNCEVLKAKRKISAHRQQQLWDAHPCSTDAHVLGKLSLCVGMPIMIRHNEATELCITKGQEGKVVGKMWLARRGKPSSTHCSWDW
jgi:hypothetical protein